MKSKKHRGIVQIIVLLLLVGLVVISLVLPALPSAFLSSEPVEVSVLMREAESSVWSSTRMGMEQAAYDLGGELRFLTPSIDNSHTSQSTLFLRELSAGTDTLVVLPADPVAFNELLIREAPELPVVSFESELSRNIPFISPDNKALGAALASECKATDGKILLLNTAGKSTGVEDRLLGCRDTLISLGAAVEVETVSTAEIINNLAALIQKNGAVTVITFEPSATQAMLEQPLPLSNTTLYGVGSTPDIVAALELDTIKGVAAWSDYAAGYLAVQAAINAKRKVKSSEDLNNILFSFVNGKEIYEESNQKLLFPVVN